MALLTCLISSQIESVYSCIDYGNCKLIYPGIDLKRKRLWSRRRPILSECKLYFHHPNLNKVKRIDRTNWESIHFMGVVVSL
ncbi:hypothetical protein scyTo_0009510 [Scyliorhinus torazame]|uniref:Uncharacterized protein n=1 Tax=Scyliorhinus torazame TaxID=75743 RepID=A0A401NNC7_SCYTO|nr:hypothetical protein [Scyliorhinus torazame]